MLARISSSCKYCFWKLIIYFFEIQTSTFTMALFFLKKTDQIFFWSEINKMSVRISNCSLTRWNIYFFGNWSNVFWVPNILHSGDFFLRKTDQMGFFLGQKNRHFSKTSKWIWFFENWSNVFEVLTSTLSAETPVILALIVKDRIEKNIFQKCSIKSIRLDLLISKISRHWHFQKF